MSSSRSAQCLLSRRPIPYKSICRTFHATPHARARRRPTYASIKAKDMGLIEERASTFKPFTKEERAAMAHKYTPQQLAAIETGEEAIDKRDLATQIAMRKDPMKISYLDDFSQVHPIIDRHSTGSFQEKSPEDAKHMVLSDEEVAEIEKRYYPQEEEVEDEMEDDESEEENWDKPLPPDALAPNTSSSGIGGGANEYRSFGDDAWKKAQATEDKRQLLWETDHRFWNFDGVQMPYDPSVRKVLLPELPKIEDREGEAETGGEDGEPEWLRLSHTTGMSIHEMKRLRTKVLVRHRVVNVTKLGKIASMYYLSVAGNQAGMLGIGEGKSTEDDDAKRQSQLSAIRNMKPIPRYEKRTIYGEVKGKIGAVELKLSSRPPGSGIRCQHLIFEMARAAGISDLGARVTRSRNKMNVVKATFEALLSQQLPEDIARARGRKLVDVRKVYYGGKVL